MAKKTWIVKHNKSIKLYLKYKDLRSSLRSVLKSQTASFQDKWEAQVKLQKLPRKSSRSSITTRCAITGRSRGIFRRYKLCRHLVRQYGLKGQIPGLTKSSW